MSEVVLDRPTNGLADSTHSDRRQRAAHTTDGLRWHYGSTAAILGIIALATVLRFSNLGYASFAHTEAWRANWTYSGGLDQARRFPPLQFLMCRAIQRVFGRQEAALRFPYALAGVGCVLAVYGVTRRLFSEQAGLLCAALTAGHPVLVYYSRRQLEYSLEALATTVLLWAGFEAYRSPTTRRILGFMLLAWLGLGFTFTASLSLAAWTPLIAFAWWRGGRRDLQKPRALAMAVLVLVLSGVAWIFWLAGNPSREVFARYYDEVEVVWPVAYSAEALLKWAAVSCYGAIHFTLGMSDTWSPLNWFLGTLYIFAGSAFLGLIWRQSRVLGTFLLILGIEVLFCGAFRLWPFGNIRHGVFLIPLVMIGVGCGLDWMFQRLGRSLPTLFLGLACVLLPLVRAARATIIAPTADEHSRPVFDYVAQHSQEGDGMFVYYFARDAYEFYMQRVDLPTLVEPPTDRGDVAAFGRRIAEFSENHPRVWFVFAHNWKNEHEEWFGHLSRTFVTLDQIECRDASVRLITRLSPFQLWKLR